MSEEGFDAGKRKFMGDVLTGAAAAGAAMLGLGDDAAAKDARDTAPGKREIVSKEDGQLDLQKLAEKCKTLKSGMKLELDFRERDVKGRTIKDWYTRCVPETK